VSGNDNDTGGDTLGNFKIANDFIKIVATNVNDFDATSDVVIGTATGSVSTAGTVGGFLATVGLYDLNSDGDFIDAGDIAINIGTGTTITTGAHLLGATKFDLTGTSAMDTLFGGSLADTINGAGGDDVINGDNNADTIIGGDGADYIRGDATGNTYSASNTDVIFLGAQTTAVGGVYPEGSDNISGTAVNSYFLDLFRPFAGNMSGVFGGANIVCGRHGDDTVIASTAKDIFWYQTMGTNSDLPGGGTSTASATLNQSGYLSGQYLGADTIHGFTVGEDAIVFTNLYGNSDHIAFGTTAAATSWASEASIVAGTANSMGWAWTSTGTGAGDLVYTSPTTANTDSNQNVTIHLVGINGTVVDVNSFFFSAVA
jgi:hypothetical protein